MLGFLRRLRRKNLKLTNVRRVMLYASGEIFLVVIGILIAVSINNWNTTQKLTAIEHTTLRRLMDDLNDDLRRYNFLDSSYVMEIGRSDSVIDLFQSNFIERKDELLSINFVDFYLIEPNLTTYEEMVNTGKMYSLSDQSLRSTINDYYRNAEKWSKYAEKRNDQIRIAYYKPELNDYRIIQWKILHKNSYASSRYSWLNNSNSNEYRDIEAFAYLTNSGLRSNLSSVRFLKRRCKELLELLENQ